MTKSVKAGISVSWNSSGGEANGKVVKTLNKPTYIKGHKVATSKCNPKVLVETAEGKRAAHKPGALKKG